MPLFTPELEFSDDYPTIEPSLRLDFANARAFDPRITFTRDSVATYIGRDGLVKYAGVNEPRFDHDPVTGESLGFLIEEQRTNFIPNGDQIGGSGWSNPGSNSSNLSTNNPAPTGENVASTWSGPGYYEVVSGTTDGTTYMMSVYAKQNNAGTDGFASLQLGSDTNTWGGGSDKAHASFNLATGTVISTTTGVVSYGIEDVGNGWYRCYVSGVKSGTGDIAVVCYTANQGTGATLYAWGAQLEAGAFLTSYIPTSGATVTREKEFPVIETSSIDFRDFSQGGEGTLVCEFSNADANGSDIAVSFSGDTHNGATFVGLGTNTNRNAFNRVRVDSTNTVLSTDTNFTTTGFYKVAFGIGQSRCTLAVRGSSSGVLEDTSVSYDSTPYTKLILGCDQTSSSSNHLISGTIKSVFYYPTLLTDTQLQTLTQ